MQIIVTQACEGSGTDSDPSRIVYYFHDFSGRLLAVTDYANNDIDQRYDSARGYEKP